MSSVPVPVSPELGDDAKQALLADGVASWLLEAFSKLKGRDPDSLAAVLAAFGTESRENAGGGGDGIRWIWG